ncbi:MAG: hypothetical protein ACRYGO_00710 [Janthinobacterium lividum]
MHAAAHLAGAVLAPACPDYLDSIARLPAREGRALSLRLHFPSFAGAADPAAALDGYLVRLKRETAMQAVLFAGMSAVRQLSFDGAAPGCLSERQFDCLLAHLGGHFRFMNGEAGDHEAALDPGGAAPGRLQRLRRQGFNRVRFDGGGADGGLDALVRLRTLVDEAREAGFRSVCVALRYGMPGQGFERLRRVLDATLAAAPDRILLCHRPGQGREEGDIPAGGVAQRMQQLCGDRLEMAAYTRTGADEFARLPGTTDGARVVGIAPASGSPRWFPGTYLVGCGVGAAGAVGPLASRNAATLDGYAALLDRNQLPVTNVTYRQSLEQTRPYLMQVKESKDADQ